jgi:PAS domain S-box-containing protein
MYSVDSEHAAAGAPIAEFLAHIHPDERTRVSERIRESVAARTDFVEEYRLIQRDGSVRWVHARGRVHLDGAGQAVRFPGVAFDITERKSSEEALRQSQDRIRAIYDGTYEYIGLLDADGVLIDCNPASLRFVDKTHEDVLGRPFWDTPWFTSTPGMPEMVRGAIDQVRTGEAFRVEMLLRHTGGERRTFDFSLHPIQNERGEVVLMVPELRDITDRKRAEEDVRLSNEELVRVNRELEEFAYVASHDLQEPLRMVNIYAQLIVQELGESGVKLAPYAGFVEQGVSRMQALIHDLLTFSKSVHPDEQPIGTADLNEALGAPLSVLKNRIEESAAVVTADRLPVVRGDVSQLAHVFQNLLSNALKYRRNDVPPEIHISAREDGANWVISVRDNGIGFEPRYADRIFGLFKRLHKEEYPGTGLGLAICKRVVERYGGRIWAEATPGQGAVFSFALPRIEGREL